MHKLVFVAIAMLMPTVASGFSAVKLYYDDDCSGEVTAVVLLRDRGEDELVCQARRTGQYLWGKGIEVNGICLGFQRFASGTSEICREINRIVPD